MGRRRHRKYKLKKPMPSPVAGLDLDRPLERRLPKRPWFDRRSLCKMGPGDWLASLWALVIVSLLVVFFLYLALLMSFEYFQALFHGCDIGPPRKKLITGCGGVPRDVLLVVLGVCVVGLYRKTRERFGIVLTAPLVLTILAGMVLGYLRAK